MRTPSAPDPITGGRTGSRRAPVTLAEIRDAALDTSRATIWWGDCAHAVVLLWFLIAVSSLVGDHPGVLSFAVLAAGFVLVPLSFAIARRRRWARLGRPDPKLPAIAIAAHLVAIVLTLLVGFSLELSAWALGLALTAEEVLLFALTRRLVRPG
jgi:hypothetical protein